MRAVVGRKAAVLLLRAQQDSSRVQLGSRGRGQGEQLRAEIVSRAPGRTGRCDLGRNFFRAAESLPWSYRPRKTIASSGQVLP